VQIFLVLTDRLLAISPFVPKPEYGGSLSSSPALPKHCRLASETILTTLRVPKKDLSIELAEDTPSAVTSS